MTVALYARRKQWPLESVTVRVKHSKIHAVDWPSATPRRVWLDRIDREILLTGPLTEEQRARLLEI
jgi:uncharacterized OsmC-like protein